ncbi:GNAT family N-acetyltransferase [Phenylobacterium sp.]|uniref:GNAT family N-acetyltransferase n=1 Tax=Phenylobacterium sp. TaxID=1871053 RepID=UPI0035B247F0
MKVALAPVAFADKGVLRPLFDAYQIAYADLTEPARAKGSPCDDPWFDAYWIEPERIPLWILADGERAGFALVNRVSPSGLGCDRAVAEFCVLPEHRRAGVGLAAARALFGRYEGVWELKVHRANAPGLAFWEKAIGAEAPAYHDVLERPDEVIHRFTR